MKFEINTDIDFYDKQLSLSEVNLHKVIIKCCEEDSSCDLSNLEFCGLLNLSFPTVQKIILKLQKLKHITVEYKRDKRNNRIIKLCKKEESN